METKCEVTDRNRADVLRLAILVGRLKQLDADEHNAKMVIEANYAAAQKRINQDFQAQIDIVARESRGERERLAAALASAEKAVCGKTLKDGAFIEPSEDGKSYMVHGPVRDENGAPGKCKPARSMGRGVRANRKGPRRKKIRKG